MKKILTSLGLAAGISAASMVSADDPVKVGFLYVSPVGEAGWTTQHDMGRIALEEHFGDDVETTFVESVPEGADAERVLTQLARSGHDIIFTTSFGYMNPTIAVAERFPDVKFEHASGYKRSENVSTYFDRIYEGRYLSGMAAGYMTETNTIGYIGAFPIPEVIRGINSFALGAKSVNPDVEVNVIWINTWYDPAKEREAAEAMINQGVDVVTFHTDSPAAVQAAEDAGIYAVGYHSDMSAYGPDAHLTAAIHNWSDYYIERVQMVMDGTWESTDTWKGLAANMTMIAPLNDAIPADAKANIEAVQASIVSGEFHPWTGPINKQDGSVALADGEVMEDGALLGMDYYVEGVLGNLE